MTNDDKQEKLRKLYLENDTQSGLLSRIPQIAINAAVSMKSLFGELHKSLSRLLARLTKSKNYKSRGATERIAVSKVNAPFRVINGEIVHLIHDGTKWVLPDSTE